MQDTGELEKEQKCGVKCLILPDTQWPDVNVATSLALSLQVLKTAQKQTNHVLLEEIIPCMAQNSYKPTQDRRF